MRALRVAVEQHDFTRSLLIRQSCLHTGIDNDVEGLARCPDLGRRSLQPARARIMSGEDARRDLVEQSRQHFEEFMLRVRSRIGPGHRAGLRREPNRHIARRRSGRWIARKQPP